MKKIFTLIAMLLLSICLFAQAPQKMNYQAVVRNASNSLVANQNVSVRISILQGSATGAAVYSETHNVQTNANGLMTLEIGGGNAASGSFAAIDWANGPYFIKSEIDPEGGINYNVTTTQQLLSVPYALYASTSGNGEGPQGPAGPQGPQGESGPAGPQGPQGPQGEPGPAGQDGTMTFADLTPEQRESLRGPQGTQGEQGVSPVISIQAISNGNRVIITSANSIDTFVVMNGTAGAQGNQGPAGPQGTPGAVGPQGPQGPQGEQGVSPVISIQAISNGNRVIITSANSIDTFVVMNGVAGAQGNPGPVGPQGNQGPQGEPGPVGPQGIQGPQGEPGPAGPQGEQGPQGPAGQDGFNPVVTITTLDTMRTQVNITSAAHPEGQNFIVRNGSSGGGFVQEQADWLENDATSNAFIVNKPVIPAAANNATLTIQKNGTEVGSFTANASVDKNININIPTATSELTNNSGFITSAEVPTQVGQLNNDANYVNNTNCPSVTFCDLYNALSNMQNQTNDMLNSFNNRLDSMQNIIDALRNQGTDTTGGTTPDTPTLTTPTITTSSVSNITTNTATCGGNVTDDGGATVTARGVCWSISENPTVEDAHTTDSVGTGNFISSITGLTAGITYYVRAYATNSEGTAYGDQVSFTTTTPDTPTLTTPTITTSSVSDITTTTATCGGNVTDDGGATITARGVCWSISENPTVEDAHTTDSVGTGNFISTITGLTAGTTYYVRAYATNSVGTAYGDQESFTTTTPIIESDTNCVLLSESFDNGNIPTGWTILDSDGDGFNWEIAPSNVSPHTGASCIWSQSYNNNSGALTPNNWLISPAVRFSSSVDSAWISYWIGTQDADYSYEHYGVYISTTGINPSDFTLLFEETLDASYTTWKQQHIDLGNYVGQTIHIAFRHFNSSDVFALKIDDITIQRYCPGTGGGTTTDTTTYTLPTVQTSSVSDITTTTATCGGNVTDDGGATITARGVCWGTSENPTVENAHTTDSVGSGNFVSTITGLTAGTTYYVRAYATNSEGTAYGEQVSFTTLNSDSDTTHHADNVPCPGTPTVSDHEGNVYNTVQIGTQCWMRENMRCTTSPSTGTTILNSNPIGYSYTGKQAYFVNDDTSNLSTYGLLYNWNATMDTFCTSYGETSIGNQAAVSVAFNGKRRGICPEGWHIPSNEEWNTLDDYVSSQNNYLCDNNTSNTAKALASVAGWDSSNVPCSVGNIPENNNATGFSAVPVGMFGYDAFGIAAAFWASNQYDYDEAYFHYLEYDLAPFNYYYDYKDNGYSVRCLRDSAISITTPSVTTASVSEITDSTATCGGNVTATGGASVTARGVCWSTSENPTVEDAHTTDSVGTGSFVSSITGLTAGTRYYVRAYATNSEGTAYGNQVSFTTTTPVIESDTDCVLLSESFDDGNIPTGWTILDADGDGYNWKIAPAGGNSHSGISCIASYSWTNAAILEPHVLTPDNWLISPAIRLFSSGNDVRLSYWVAMSSGHSIEDSGASLENEHYGVYISTTGTNPSDFTLLYEETVDDSYATWEPKVINLGSYAEQTIRIAFRHFNSTDAYCLKIDDIIIQRNCPGIGGGTATDWLWIGTGRNPNDSRPCSDMPIVSDHEGNVYNTVQIGNQCWTKENMRCATSPSTGTTILEYPAVSYSYSGKKAYYVNGNVENTSVYGLLYNYNAAIDVFNPKYGETSTNEDEFSAPFFVHSSMVNRRGICPQGWHVPNAADWTQLMNYVSNQNQYVCGVDNINIVKALSSPFGWYSDDFGECSAGTMPSSNNITGFSAVPAGEYRPYYSSAFGFDTKFWGVYGDYYQLYIYRPYVDVYNTLGVYGPESRVGKSVRCLRNETVFAIPTVSTSLISEITNATASSGGAVTSDGGIEVTARGVCWSTSPNPTINDAHTTDDSGIGTFTSTITGLIPNTTYYVRAYATNNLGTAYGERLRFYTSEQEVQWDGTGINPNDSKPCTDMPTVTDHEGNVYNTVQIGSQCWTKENIRCTTSPSTGANIISSSAILSGTDNDISYTGKKAYYYIVDPNDTVNGYKLLYNWCAAMDIFNPEYGETSSNTSRYAAQEVVFTGNIRGICPEGWHVPSTTEWDVLTTYVSGQTEYLCGNDSSYIAKALASNVGWDSHFPCHENCNVSNELSSNNATGFSAEPYNIRGGLEAFFWTASQISQGGYSSLAYLKGFNYNDSVVQSISEGKASYIPVRCLRD